VATDASSLVAGRNRRVVLIVALAALVAAAAVVGATVLQSRGERTTVPGAVTTPKPGRPPLVLELGLRSDPEARALAQAQTLYVKDHEPAQAAAIFRRYHSLEAQLGLAFTAWRGPSSLAGVRTLVAAHPNDPAGALNLGWADYWAGRNADAAAAWQETARRWADTPYGVDAEDALHGGPTGLPPLLLGLAPPPRSISSLPARQELAALKAAAARPDEHAKLLYGYTLWSLERPLSAERQFAAAARLAQTAAAVGLFSKGNPVRAFGRLGPLTAVFPHSAVVEFHLGVLLLYIDKPVKSAEHLRAAAADAPGSPYAKAARTLLASLGRNRPK
jgi:hypothetical protein